MNNEVLNLLKERRDNKIRGLTDKRNEKIDAIGREYDLNVAEAGKKYAEAGARSLYVDLRKSQLVMTGRCEGIGFDDGALERLRKYRSLRSGGEMTDKAFEGALGIAGESSEFIGAVFADEGRSDIGLISTYVVMGGDYAQIVSPARMDVSNELNDALSGKLTAIMGASDISTKSGTASIVVDPANLHGYLGYRIGGVSNGDLDSVIDSLRKRFSDLQPESFKEVNLVHVLEELGDISWVEYLSGKEKSKLDGLPAITFLNRVGDRKYIRINELEGLLQINEKGIKMARTRGDFRVLEGNHDLIEVESVLEYEESSRGGILEGSLGHKGVRVRETSLSDKQTSHRVPYGSHTPDEAKEIAFKKLRKLGINDDDLITSDKVADILGFTNNRSASSFILRNEDEFGKYMIERNRAVKVGDLKKFIEGRERTNRGWMPIGWKRDK